MALKETSRFSIICYQKDAQKLLDFLALKRIFHPEVYFKSGDKKPPFEEPGELRKVSAEIQFCISKLKPLLQTSGLSEMIEDKRPAFTFEELAENFRQLNIEEIYHSISQIAEKIDQTLEENQKIESEIQKFEELRDLTVKKYHLKNTSYRHFSLFLGRAKKTDYEELLKEAPDFSTFFNIETKNDKQVLFLAVFLKDVEPEFERLAAEKKVQKIELPEKMKDEESFKDYFDRLQLQKLENLKNLEIYRNALASYIVYYDRLLAALEFVETEIEKIEKSSLFKETKNCLIIEGWVPAEKASKLKKEIEERFVCEVIIENPDLPLKPVVLENKGTLKSIQMLTELYGVPNPKEVDPTPVIAPYFLTFFGFCIGDAGYGVLMILLSLILKLKFKLKDSVKSFVDIFAYSGIGAVIIGILSGSYFSIEAKNLPSFLLKMKLFDPIENPVSILGLSLILGFIHLLTGIVLSFYLNFKQKNPVFYAEAGKGFLLIGAGIYLALSFLTPGSSVLKQVSTYILLAGVTLIVLFSAPEVKNPIRRLLAGLYNIYGMTSYLGDVSSYARLMALMLAGVLIGMAVNILARLATDLLGFYAGIPVAVLIGLFGHLFNLVMSLVSGFVHSLRLQYVEFFKQFYSDGGVKFNPLGVKENYIKLLEKN